MIHRPRNHRRRHRIYIRTYYSLLRSSGDIRIRSLEETHEGMLSSLHLKAESAEFDVSGSPTWRSACPTVSIRSAGW